MQRNTCLSVLFFVIVPTALIVGMISACDLRIGSARPAIERTACRKNLELIYKSTIEYLKDHTELPRSPNGDVDLRLLFQEPSDEFTALHSIDDYVPNPAITMEQLASKDNRVPFVVDNCENHVDRDDIIVANAVLASGAVRSIKLPVEDYRDWLDRFRQGDWHDTPYHQ